MAEKIFGKKGLYGSDWPKAAQERTESRLRELAETGRAREAKVSMHPEVVREMVEREELARRPWRWSQPSHRTWGDPPLSGPIPDRYSSSGVLRAIDGLGPEGLVLLALGTFAGSVVLGAWLRKKFMPAKPPKSADAPGNENRQGLPPFLAGWSR